MRLPVSAPCPAPDYRPFSALASFLWRMFCRMQFFLVEFFQFFFSTANNFQKLPTAIYFSFS
jgi:hypothetical protein